MLTFVFFIKNFTFGYGHSHYQIWQWLRRVSQSAPEVSLRVWLVSQASGTITWRNPGRVSPLMTFSDAPKLKSVQARTRTPPRTRNASRSGAPHTNSLACRESERMWFRCSATKPPCLIPRGCTLDTSSASLRRPIRGSSATGPN